MEMNCKSLVSPQPVLFAREALDTMDPGDELDVVLDNDAAADELIEFAVNQGHKAERTTVKGDMAVKITKGTNDKVLKPARQPENIGSIITVSSSRFGQGNPRLGESLMSSWFYVLTNSDPLPDAILFFNAGVALCCKDSPVLRDLKTIVSEGVKVYVDEASLNFYGYSDNLEIGEKKDLSTMAGMMLAASKVTAI